MKGKPFKIIHEYDFDPNDDVDVGQTASERKHAATMNKQGTKRSQFPSTLSVEARKRLQRQSRDFNE